MNFFKLLVFATVLASGWMALAQSSFVDETKINYADPSLSKPNAPYMGISHLTVFVYPPSSGLDWDTPKGLLYSFLGGEIVRELTLNKDVEVPSDNGNPGAMSSQYRSSMGHTLLFIHCQTTSKRTVNRWVSFSGQDRSEVDKKNMKDGLGMGLLFYDYNDGHIVNGPENQLRLALYHDTAGITDPWKYLWPNEPRYIRYMIDGAACERLDKMAQFFVNFGPTKDLTLDQLKAREPYSSLYFTATMDPYETYMARQKNSQTKVGGGCAPFGAALVKQAGFYEPIYESEWKFSKDVDERMIGGTTDPKTGEVRKVSIGNLVSPIGKGWSWNTPGKPARRIVFYDPQLIWDFAGKALDCAADHNCEPEVRQWLASGHGTIPGVAKKVRLGPKLTFEAEGHTNEVEGVVVYPDP